MPTRFNPTDIASNYAALSAINDNFDDIATLLDTFVSRTGAAPNAMLANLDMNHFKIQNLADAIADTDAVNKRTMETAIANTVFQTLSDAEVVSSRALMAGLTATDGSLSYLTEDGREGFFKFDDSDLSTRVTADPGQGVYVPPSSDTTGASGAWVRITDYLTPEMFGATGVSDDTTAILRMFYLAQTMGLSCYSFGETAYPIGQATNILVGSLDGTTAPASGFLDNLRMLGTWRFITKANLDAILEFRNGTNLFIGDVDFDITTEATNATGQLRFLGCKRVTGGTVTKIGESGNGFVTGGSALSLQTGTEIVYFRKVEVEHASPNSSAVLTIGANAFFIGEVRCVGGQDAIDVSGTSSLTFGRPFWGAHLVYGEDVGELIDAGNASGGVIDIAIGKNCDDVVVCKTENSGAESLGTVDLKIGRLLVEEWTGQLISMQAGATSDQVLHNLEIGEIIARTTTATTDTRAFRFVVGDVALEPTSGFRVGRAVIEANDGTTFEMNGMINYVIENVTSNMPTAITSSTSANFSIERQNGLFRNCSLTGNISCSEKGVTFEDVVTTGRFRVTDGRHNRYVRSGVRNSQTLGIDLLFTVEGDQDVELIDCFAENVGLDGSANQYALGIWRNGSDISVTGIRVKNFIMKDLQRELTFTSGGTVEPSVGDRVYGNTSGAFGIINKITLTSGSWAAGDAAGTLLLRDVHGTFQAETLTLRDQAHAGATGVLSADVATASGADVAAPTSYGLRLSGLDTDDCELIGVRNQGITDGRHISYGFEGARSVNAHNRIEQTSVRSVSSAHTLQMRDVNRTLQMTANFDFTLDGNGPVFPVGTVFYLQNQAGAAVNVTTANGAVLNSAGGLLGITQDGEVTLRIVSHSPLTAQLVGDLT